MIEYHRLFINFFVKIEKGIWKNKIFLKDEILIAFQIMDFRTNSILVKMMKLVDIYERHR